MLPDAWERIIPPIENFDFLMLDLDEMVKAWEGYHYPQKPTVPGKIILLLKYVRLEYSTKGWSDWGKKVGFEKFRGECVEFFGVDPFEAGSAHLTQLPTTYTTKRSWCNKTKQGVWLVTIDDTPNGSDADTGYIEVFVSALEPNRMPRDD